MNSTKPMPAARPVTYGQFCRMFVPPVAAVVAAYAGALACCAAALSATPAGRLTLGVLLPLEVAVIMLAGKLTNREWSVW